MSNSQHNPCDRTRYTVARLEIIWTRNRINLVTVRLYGHKQGWKSNHAKSYTPCTTNRKRNPIQLQNLYRVNSLRQCTIIISDYQRKTDDLLQKPKPIEQINKKPANQINTWMSIRLASWTQMIHSANIVIEDDQKINRWITNQKNKGWISADRNTRLLSCLQYPVP